MLSSSFFHFGAGLAALLLGVCLFPFVPPAQGQSPIHCRGFPRRRTSAKQFSVTCLTLEPGRTQIIPSFVFQLTPRASKSFMIRPMRS